MSKNHEIYCGCDEKNCTAMWRFRFLDAGLRGIVNLQVPQWSNTDDSIIVVHMLCPRPSTEPRSRRYAGTEFYLSCNCGEVDFDNPPQGHREECAVSVFWKVQEVRSRLDAANRERKIPTVYGRAGMKAIAGNIWMTSALGDDLIPLRTIINDELRAQVEAMIDHEILHGYQS